MITYKRTTRFSITLTFFLFAVNMVFAQDYSLPELKEQYPDQIGVITLHSQVVDIDIDKTGELEIYKTDREEMLYLKESAKFYGDQSISMSHFFEDVLEVAAYSTNAKGKTKKLKEEDFKVVDSQPSSWVFHDDNKEMVFSFEDLGEGSKSVIEYRKKIKKAEFFDVFHFISGYPVLSSQIQINYPETVEIKYFERAMEGFTVVKRQESNKGEVSDFWEINNLDAFKEEEGSTNIKNHIPHLIAQIQSYEFNGERKKLITNVDELHAYFEEFLLLKEDESNRKELNEVVMEITEGLDDPVAKMDTIFKWVQANIKYIAFEDGINGYVPRSCTSVMRNRYGDCKDMGNLLVEMLTYAGVENAYVAWVGTRDVPYLMSEIPSPLTCNHVICVVEKPDSLKDEHPYFYLDATNPESSYLLPPMALQEKELLVHVASGKHDLFKVPSAHADNNYIRSVIRYTIDSQDSLIGSGVDYYGGYERENRAYYLSNLKDEDLTDYVKDLALGGANRYTLKEYEIKGVSEKQKPLELHYDFTVDNLAISDGDEIILNPTLFKPRVTKYHTEDYKFTREKGKHRTIDYSYEVVIPEDLGVKHLPEDVHFKHDLFHFDAAFELKENILHVDMKYQYHLLEIPTAMFEDWNAFSASINSATIQNIILEKK